MSKLYALSKDLMLFALMLLPALAMAGGLAQEGTSVMTSIRDGMYTIVEVGGGAFILIRGVQLWADRKTGWDFILACLYVGLAGAAIAIASSIFHIGSQVTI